MIKKYRKLPLVIEALQRTEENLCAILSFCGPVNIKVGQLFNTVHIYTLEGSMACEIGDYIIKDIAGEFYPCKPEIFEATYEEVL